jgi:mannitol-1-phosphate 5-dehydrogenase
MKAVHFGAGNIGRGFIGLLLYQSGYETIFIDVNDQLIQALNKQNKYKVILAAENRTEQIVENVSGINSVENRQAVIEAIIEADIITTAIGPNILPFISELLAEGLQMRKKQTGLPLHIIACENMVGGSSFLQEKVLEHISEEEKKEFFALYCFPDAAVDRIVPNQTNEDLLGVSVEPYYEWVVEDQTIEGKKPKVKGMTYVNDLTPYIERKLFTVNTGHAVPAYIGHYLKHDTIKAAMEDQRVQTIIKGALMESGEALIQTYGFNREEHQQYIDTIIQRFMNPYISDEVTRVGRGPLRKLGPNDRLIRPSLLYMDVTEKEPTYLATVIAATLHYENKEDEEAVKLQKMIAEKGYKKTMQVITGLDENHRLLQVVSEEYNKLVKLT